VIDNRQAARSSSIKAGRINPDVSIARRSPDRAFTPFSHHGHAAFAQTPADWRCEHGLSLEQAGKSALAEIENS
jgi:hypothetical protein